MRILIVTPDYPPGRGGIQQLVGRLAVNLNADEVDVVTMRSAHAERARERVGNVRVTRISRPGRLGQHARVALLNCASVAVALRRRPDVLFVGHVVLAPAAALIARVIGRPYVLFLHSQEISHRPGLTRFAVKHSATTAAVSSHARAEAVAAGADADRIVVTNPGVDLPASPAPRQSDRPTVVTVARMVDRYKGHDVMLDAVERLRSTIPDILWIAVGDGPLRAEYERESDLRGLSGNVQLRGAVSDAVRDELLDRADLFAMPSRVPEHGGGEGFGLVYLEAAARGLPVVAGDEGGAVDAVLDGRTGLLVNPRDPQAVAAAIESLITDAERAARFGAAARRHAEAHDWPAFASSIRALLVKATQRPRARASTRVLAVSHTSAYGGAERSLVTQLAQDISDGQVEAVLVAPSGPLLERGREAGLATAVGPAFERSFRVTPIEYPRLFNELLNAGRCLATLARSHSADVVHANSVRAGLIAVCARAFGGPPVITHVRDCLPDTRVARATRHVTRLGSRAIVANSQHTAASFGPGVGGAAPFVVYNALERAVDAPTPDALADTRSRHGIAPGEPLLTVVGQITPWKGQDVAIRALAEIRAELPNAKLAIVGSVKFSGGTRLDNDHYAASLKHLADELGVADAVIFTGELDDAGGVMAASEIVLMPSWEEPFGRAAIEAMALARPVIATTVGGPPEFIEHGRNGLLADPTVLADWTHSALELLRDAERAEELGVRARETVTRRFAVGSSETRMLPLYLAAAPGQQEELLA